MSSFRVKVGICVIGSFLTSCILNKHLGDVESTEFMPETEGTKQKRKENLFREAQDFSSLYTMRCLGGKLYILFLKKKKKVVVGSLS